MKKVTFAIVGLGNRGRAYASKQLKYPEEMEVVAIADNRRIQLDSVNEYLHLPESCLYDGADAILAQEKLADVMVIATQDAQHLDHAMKALDKGYDLLLEKPISNDLAACRAIAKRANELGRTVIVCHVLRYTVFYQKLKELIDSGIVGKVENIHAVEMIGYYHFAHSFVRGNWHKMSDSSPLMLAKCCHDMDLLLWLSGKHWISASSYGSLDHFTHENCPEGATERCHEGCTADCPFHAPNFYFSRLPGWPTHVLNPNPTRENIQEALETTNYGRCVYKMDNDVPDHQTLSVLLEDGVTASFTVSAFNHHQDRNIHIMGTKGHLWGDFRSNIIHVGIYGQDVYDIDVGKLCDDFTGHGGGDARLVRDVIRLMRGDDFDRSAITSIDRSVESHELAFAAEASRLRGGVPVHPGDLPG